MICKKYHLQFTGKFCRRCGAPVIHFFSKNTFAQLCKYASYLTFLIPFIIIGIILCGIVFGLVHVRGCVSVYNQRIEKEEADFRNANSPQWIALLDQISIFSSSDKKIEAVKNFTSNRAEKDCSFEVFKRLVDDMFNDDTKLKMVDIVMPCLKEPLSPDEKTKILKMFMSDDNKQTFMTKVYKKP